MVAVIGGVVCLYVIVRCADIVGSDSAAGGTKLLAATTAIAALVAIFVIALVAIDIVGAGLDVSNQLERLGR
jgi:hypothetical protein